MRGISALMPQSTTAVPRATIVIPCYNEQARLCPAAFAAFLRTNLATLLFVDDGSRDGTADALRRFCADHPQQAALLQLPTNRGKAEAVRQGMVAAMRKGAPFVGFWDADLATPLDSLPLFLAEFDAHPAAEMILGSRVQLLGRTIDRRALRHYLGRAFATVVSRILALAVYDTQCGAKLFRSTPMLEVLFRTPFLANWVFDVEILARFEVERRRLALSPLTACVRELPLPTWRDVAGSKIRPQDIGRVALDLWRIDHWRRRALAQLAATAPLTTVVTREARLLR